MLLLSVKVVMIAALALAQTAPEDDDLAPLAPISKPKIKAKAKVRSKSSAKRLPMKSVEPIDDLAPLGPVSSRGEIAIKVTPDVSGAAVSIDGKSVGILPLPPLALDAGDHTISVRRAGFAQLSQKVTVAIGKTTQVEARLVPIAGVLSVKTDQPDAKVFVDGKLIGSTPLTEVEIAPGTVQLSVLKEGIREERQTISVIAGKDYPVSISFGRAPVPPQVADLRPRPAESPTFLGISLGATPLTERPVFWVAVGVAAAAVAVTSAVIVYNNLPPLPVTEKDICPPDNSDCASACIGFTCAVAGQGVKFEY